MTEMHFIPFQQIEPQDLLLILNDPVVRKHLIDHKPFTSHSIREWVAEKRAIDALDGCRIRAITMDGVLAGWCGIQPDDQGVELAIVLSQPFWGAGVSVFKVLMAWANELGHEEVLFHLLDSRRDYKALAKLSTRIAKTRLLGHGFTTYYMPVQPSRTK